MDTTTKTLLLISVGYIIYRYYKNWKEYNAEQAELTWPRKIQPCPDYWVKTNNGKCKNMFNIGNVLKQEEQEDKKWFHKEKLISIHPITMVRMDR